MGPNIQGYDGHEHTVKRGLVSPAFRRTAIPRYVEPLLRPVAEELADDLAPLGEADLMATFAKKYPMRIITRLLGIPRDDEDKMASLGQRDAQHRPAIPRERCGPTPRSRSTSRRSSTSGAPTPATICSRRS